MKAEMNTNPPMAPDFAMPQIAAAGPGSTGINGDSFPLEILTPAPT